MKRSSHRRRHRSQRRAAAPPKPARAPAKAAKRSATPQPTPQAKAALAKENRDAWRLRRWETSAGTNRLNHAQWEHAYGRTINEDLLDRLENLRIRCEHHIARDPIMEGVVSTFSGDVVGQTGPKVQVQSDDVKFNADLEEAIEEYHERPDPTIDATIADVLRVDVRSLCTSGEYLHQFTHGRRTGPFEFAIRSPHPRRLETPAGMAGTPNFFMGLELDATGAVKRYHIRDEPPGIFARSSMNWRPIDAQNMQHKFMRQEPDQLRGFPLLAVALDDMGDRIQLNKYVIEAAKNAAAQGILWYTDHPEAMIDFGFSATGESHPLEPGMQQAGPPGYKPFMINPTQPGAQWREFDHEKLRGYGRPFGMPLMMVLLSSEGNSFSGANHDGQIYIRSVGGFQTGLFTGTLTPQYNQIATEVAIATNRRRPRKLRYEGTWTQPPHPDPKKNYEALRMQLEDGAISLSEVCAKLGRDFESVAAARAFVNKKLDELELPRPPVNAGGHPSNSTFADSIQDDESFHELQANKRRRARS